MGGSKGLSSEMPPPALRMAAPVGTPIPALPVTRLPSRWSTLLLMLAAACGGEVADDRPAPAPPAPGDPIVEEMAADGERLFRVKGCLACHKIQGGPSVGPDLAGVTERRDYPWYHAMVTNPDSMLAMDPIARELLARYRTRMVYQRITEYEVRAIFEYLRRSPIPWEATEGAGP
jgi:mono/diheme cytochrome c family protein